jgi:hypothetical protein
MVNNVIIGTSSSSVNNEHFKAYMNTNFRCPISRLTGTVKYLTVNIFTLIQFFVAVSNAKHDQHPQNTNYYNQQMH